MPHFFKIIPGLLFLLVSAPGFAQKDSLLAKTGQLLHSGKSVSEILSDPQFDSIRPETEFREQIRQSASQPAVTLVVPSEPGTRVIAKGRLQDSQGQPLSHTLVYVYQTDTRGWYGSDRVHFQMMEGDRRHARLFAYLKTDGKGQFELSTIQPHGYPQSDLPAHIHFEVFDGNGQALLITELLFDDDERLQGEIRSRSEKEGFFISKPVIESNQKIYHYTIPVRHN